MSLVAWLVRDDDTDRAEIVFAHTEQHAARISELSADSVERTPVFDCFAPGPVPISSLLAAGWWWTCSFCDHDVSGHGCDECADERESGVYAEPVINDKRCEVYCSQACADADAAERKTRMDREEEVRAECRAALPLWPDLEIVSVCGVGLGRQHESVGVLIPGLRFGAVWRPRDPNTAEIDPLDVEAYERLRNERKARAAGKETKP